MQPLDSQEDRNPATRQPGGIYRAGEKEKKAAKLPKKRIRAAGQADPPGRPDWKLVRVGGAFSVCPSVFLWVLAPLITSCLYQPGLAGRAENSKCLVQFKNLCPSCDCWTLGFSRDMSSYLELKAQNKWEINISRRKTLITTHLLKYWLENSWRVEAAVGWEQFSSIGMARHRAMSSMRLEGKEDND